ncbi:ROK family transcriptional regulator [Candidatus Cetobacterium colombiensis]|uniref:ROK family transcriptional regulator n=1 Tax=Candidatus Cetobacterium colombiensis TaxID=3073100 RepID=A0ABU4W942_9FUSO|nr:ROK family transcriptional regulator [Candidatus Cetobacterium colombiensis]MDX8335018.1 ROK family transcriptional regulator [Candidatus Cetobacterium colombiensis]
MEFTQSQLRILEMIKNKNRISRKKIAEELELTPAAITKSIEPLLQCGIVLEVAQRESTGGRRAIDLSLNKHWVGKILGISLTPTSLVVSVGNIEGEILKTSSYIIDENKELIDYLEEVIELELKENVGIKVISMAITGLINSENGIIIFTPHYKRKKINIRDRIEKRFNRPVLIENDVRSMALTEKYFGEAHESENYVVLNVSEGIGSSIFVNGNLLSGHGSISGEIGHVIMDRSSLRKCSCGKRGCLEAEASNKAIINRLVSMIKLNNYSSLKEKLKIKGTIDIFDVLHGVKERDFLSTKVSTEAMVIIAHSIDMIISLINPEKIILIGELFKENLLLSTLKLELQKVTLEEQKYDLIVSNILDKMHIYNPISVVRHNLFKKHLWRDEF